LPADTNTPTLASACGTHDVLLHSANPALQVKPQRVPSHVDVAFVGGWHAVHEVPQLLTELLLSQLPLQL
jgi:hypothetical protein